MTFQVAEHTYIFIDGEYLRRIHDEAMRDFFGVDGDLDLSELRDQARALRAFFYDSIDDTPREGENAEACQARLAPLEEFFARSRALSGVHVRLGTVVGKRSRKKEPRQKEVDILLATDMLTHGFNGSMQKAVLLAGDLDFRPIVEALVRHGVFVEVWYHRSSVAQDLPGAADFGHVIRFRELYSWNSQRFQDAHRVPRDEENVGQPRSEFLKAGSVKERYVQLYRFERSDGPIFQLWIDTGGGTSITISDADVNLIERYVAAQYAPIVWEVKADEFRTAG